MGTSAQPPNTSSRGLGYGRKVAEALADGSPSCRLLDPQGVGLAGSTDCGSIIRVEIKASNGLISDSHFEAYGCPATLAAARYAAECVRGLTIDQAAMIGEARIAEALQLGPDKRDWPLRTRPMRFTVRWAKPSIHELFQKPQVRLLRTTRHWLA